MLVGHLRTLNPISSPRPQGVVFGAGQWQRTKPQGGRVEGWMCVPVCCCCWWWGWRAGGTGKPYTQRIHSHSHKDSRALWASSKGFASLGTKDHEEAGSNSPSPHTTHTHTVSLTRQRPEIMSPYPLAVHDAGVWLAMWTDVHVCAIKWNEAEKLSHHAV